MGSGTLGVTRAFVAEVTAQRNRTTYMAWITAVQYTGFTVTPFVGALFNKTLANVDVNFGYVNKGPTDSHGLWVSVISPLLCSD